MLWGREPNQGESRGVGTGSASLHQHPSSWGLLRRTPPLQAQQQCPGIQQQVIPLIRPFHLQSTSLSVSLPWMPGRALVVRRAPPEETTSLWKAGRAECQLRTWEKGAETLITIYSVGQLVNFFMNSWNWSSSWSQTYFSASTTRQRVHQEQGVVLYEGLLFSWLGLSRYCQRHSHTGGMWAVLTPPAITCSVPTFLSPFCKGREQKLLCCCPCRKHFNVFPAVQPTTTLQEVPWLLTSSDSLSSPCSSRSRSGSQSSPWMSLVCVPALSLVWF